VLVELLAVALAAPLTSPPPGATELTLQVCHSACDDEAWWLGVQPAWEDEPILLAQALAYEQAALLVERRQLQVFEGALARGEAAFAAGDLDEAAFELGYALDALERSTATASNAAHARLYLTLAATRQELGPRFAAPDLYRAAAALAWTQPLDVPEALVPYRQAYDDALVSLLAERLATVSLEGDAVYALDGVLLGPGPVQVRVFPGPHRLTATEPVSGRQWREHVEVGPGQAVTARARFVPSEDGDWLNAELAALFTEGRMSTEAADLLTAWARAHHLRELQLVMAETTDPQELLFEVHAVRYDPASRMLSGAAAAPDHTPR